MTEFYNEHDCDCHIHPHKDPIEDLQMFVANYYTSLLTKLRNHIKIIWLLKMIEQFCINSIKMFSLLVI